MTLLNYTSLIPIIFRLISHHRALYRQPIYLKKGAQMRTGWITGLIILLSFSSMAYAEEAASLKTQRDRVSYIIGRDAGTHIKNQLFDIDPDIFMRGFRDALSGNKSSLSDDETRETMAAFKEERMKKHEEEVKKVTEKNKKEGEAFLAENKKKEGVVTLPSGLQYKVIKEGDGQTPKETATVTVNYRGTLLDGTEVDSSYKRNEPATFPVKGVIPGWQEALQLMKVGSKWQLFIPAGLAYGERGTENLIGPNATLIFEVELLSIEDMGSGSYH
jgi:FKBP-type peptidyl-prolyl cis-trans isomerase FklB